jgi:hypothetical protein
MPPAYTPPATAPSTNLIQNGDFEFSSCAIGQPNCQSSDASAIAPWTITSANKAFELFGHTEPNRFSMGPTRGGDKWALDLNSDSPYTIGQTVTTVPGKTYVVQFSISSNVACGAGDKTGYVQASAATAAPHARRGNKHHNNSPPPPPAPNTPANGAQVFSSNSVEWKDVTYTFVAQTASTLVEIGSSTTNTPACGPLLDHVSVIVAN